MRKSGCLTAPQAPRGLLARLRLTGPATIVAIVAIVAIAALASGAVHASGPALGAGGGARVPGGTALGALPAAAIAGAKPAPNEPARVVLKGEIVDLGCYLMHEGRGDTHATCAQACVKGGAPVGLLADGVLYVLFAPHDTLAPFEEAKRLVGKNATVTGVLHDRGGLRGVAVTLVASK